MITVASARTLLGYKAWAGQKMFEAVSALPAGEATKERPTLFKTMVGTLNHIYVVDRVWQAHLEGREHGIPALSTVMHAELPALWSAQREIDAWYTEWAARMTDATLGEQVRFSLIGGNAGVMSRGAIVQHVVTHGNYHRGWVADLFFQVPTRPPLMDLPVYQRETGATI